MNCPVCSNALTEINARGTKVDICQKGCGGIWFDRFELSQVDNPYVSPFGGAAALIEKMKGNSLFGHVTLEKTVRSPLAELASNLL